MSNANLAIKISDLGIQIRNNWGLKSKQILKGINLEIFQGESFGFLGHNGAGKTTTIKAILGLIRPTTGSVQIFGLDARETNSRRAVGYLAEQPYFYDSLTVRETLTMFATLSGIERSKIDSAVVEASEIVKITPRLNSSMRSLSKGLTQRVGLAQAILNNPRLLILDEPFSGLDPIGRREFREIFNQLKSYGTTLFICSHVLSDVEFLCDRASIMVKGELKSVVEIDQIPRLNGGRYELITDNKVRFESITTVPPKVTGKTFRFEFSEKELADQALENAVKVGAHIESFNFIQSSLEDLFVDVVKFDESKNEVRDE